MQENFENSRNNAEKLITAIGSIIKKHRINQSKTIYAVSAEASMSKATWREVEIGACKDIKLTTLWKISEGLDIPLSDILNETKKELGSEFYLSD